MNKRKGFGPIRRELYTYKELPIGSTSIGIHEDVIRTGQWRYSRPVFKNKIPPCNDACPAGVDVRGFTSLIKQKRFEDAFRLYVWENPFPAICGRVCFYPCERVCNRKDFDQAVAINALERFISEFESPLPQVNASEGGQVAVVGSGPAGLSCAHFLSLLGHRVAVFEALSVAGGLPRIGIPSFRLPQEIVTKELKKLERMGVQFEMNHRIDGKNWKDLEVFDAVFLAYGAYEDLPSRLSPEKNPKIISGISFLRTVNTGGQVELGKRVAIIGGGNTAIDAARVSLRLGSLPTVIYRRSRNEMPAFESEIENAIEEGVQFLFLASPLKTEAKGSKLRLELVKNRLGVPDSDGRRSPVPIANSQFVVETDSIISAVGEKPDLTFLPESLRNSSSSIPVTGTFATNKPGFYAGGDVTDQPRTVADAIGSGKKSAIAIDSYIRGRDLADLMEAFRIGNVSFQSYCEGSLSPETGGVIYGEDLNLSYYEEQKRLNKPKNPRHSHKDFGEIYGNLSRGDAVDEANRCFNCGICDLCDNCYLYCPDGSIKKSVDKSSNAIDYDYCKGCGICENECPSGVIEMEKED